MSGLSWSFKSAHLGTLIATALVVVLSACTAVPASVIPAQGAPSETSHAAASGVPGPEPSGTPGAGLPLCQSPTATGCDRSAIDAGAGTNGSPGCVGKGTTLIGTSPIDLNEIALIQPMGLMIGGHVTPIDHGYIYVKGAKEQPPRQVEVKAPFDGLVTHVSRMTRPGGPTGHYDDYAMTIEATCTFRIEFTNLVGFAGGVGDHLGQLQPNEQILAEYPVEEGELIGFTGDAVIQGIDLALHNDDTTLSGFVDLAYYANQPSKLNVVDLFEYMEEPLKSQLLALNMREALPRFGKIDHDIDGRLVGTWFRQGSGLYEGLNHGGEGYWSGHLSIVPDGNDPTQTDVSFGDYAGQAAQFAVIGNKPDPATVSEASGPIAYELGQIVIYNGDTGEFWDRLSYLPHIRVRANSDVLGTVLFQLIGPRQLKMEIFDGKTAAEVKGFDSNALIYER